MKLWTDAHLSPRLAGWIAGEFSIHAEPLRNLGLSDAEDDVIFAAARAVNAIVLTKDSDFLQLLKRHGSPPKVIWLTCGNTSEQALRDLLALHLATALELLEAGRIWSKSAKSGQVRPLCAISQFFSCHPLDA